MEYECDKCGSTQSSESEVVVTGTGLSRLFDIQNNAFETVTCDECGYTEFYKKDRGKKGQVLDFFFG